MIKCRKCFSVFSQPDARTARSVIKFTLSPKVEIFLQNIRVLFLFHGTAVL